MTNTADEHTANELILKFSCADRPGLVADVAGFFFEQGFNIRESSQFEDTASRRFFMRTEFEAVDSATAPTLAAVRDAFAALTQRDDMDWQLCPREFRPRALIAVSRWGHCLNTLLNAWKSGSLPLDIVGVFSNHPDMRDLVAWYGLPYFYHPVSRDNKAEQESQLAALLHTHNVDLLVLARYMQILRDDLCRQWAGRAINIHHSFLPGFKGAKPYHQAHARGVKLIGATAHYVTPELDEGPIIEQAVERVSHANTPEELTEIGRDIEAVVLQRAVRWHAEHRILLNGNKTVVFSR